jgi:hypothetical protein
LGALITRLGMMSTPIEQLGEMIQGRFPQIRCVLDPPDHPQASWWLDLNTVDHEVTVEWRPSFGFGVSARPDAVFGERSDELYDSLESTFARVQDLILNRTHTPAP